MMAPRIAGFKCCQSPSVLGDRDEVGAVEHAGDAGHAEQFFGERRARGGFAAGEFHGAAVEHGAAWNEFQRGGIGRGFGLNEHGFLRRRRFKAGALALLSRWRRLTHDQGAQNQRFRLQPHQGRSRTERVDSRAIAEIAGHDDDGNRERAGDSPSW